MARLDLPENQKFKRLALALNGMASGMGAQLARGLLETLWSAAYERADDFLGDAFDVTLAADWKGDPETFVRLLVAAPAGKAAGFIRFDEGRGGYVIHDFDQHAPQWVKVKMAKKAEREAAGQTLSDIRRAAALKSKTARAMQTAESLPATEEQTNNRLPAKNDNGTGRDGTGRVEEELPPEKSGGGAQGVIPGLASNGTPASPTNGSPKRRGRPPGKGRSNGSPDSLPFTIADAMSAVAHGVLVNPFPQEPKFATNLTRLIRQYPDLSTWRRIADWLASGGDGWNTGRRGKPDLGILIARFGGWMQQASAKQQSNSDQVAPPDMDGDLSGFPPLEADPNWKPREAS